MPGSMNVSPPAERIYPSDAGADGCNYCLSAVSKGRTLPACLGNRQSTKPVNGERARHD